MEVEQDNCNFGSETATFEEDSTTSITSSSSSELRDDASSSTSSSSSPPQNSKGPLFELSELMAQLPIKRGLSKYYQGKSQSFTSLSNVRCLDDFAKRETPYRKKLKSSKSYGGRLCTPKALISKKSSRGYASSLGKRGSFMGSCRPPLPVQKNQCI
ncbi:hypothetical protein NE237_025882 [Protea cynaroides]|uniref:Oxidative stress 3 n=1 Tax=Protea cynaroides TaxID=273540 RepID=A0A9Q0K0M1_9MAGN|nr:hypothetical protein NE237_025882 [Protea cynaroides]